jgi:hypothetical protein
MKQAHPAVAVPPEITGDPPDGEVIERSRYEPELFALLFRRHAADIARYAARRLGPGPAEDMVAETFLAAFRQRGGYDVTGTDARPWLYGIAGNLPAAVNNGVPSGPYIHIRKGQVTGEDAVLKSGIVQHAGQLP